MNIVSMWYMLTDFIIMVCSDFVDDDEMTTDCSLPVFASLHTLLPIYHQELAAIPPLLESELAMRIFGAK